MTLKRKNDSDKIQCRLTPAEQHILEWAKQRPDQPFCFREFLEKYAHGTIRNAFLRLKNLGLIRRYCRSFTAFYVLASSKVKPSCNPVTLTHTGGRHDVRRLKIDLGSFLDSLDWEDVCRVHNVVLNFSVDGLYDYYLKETTCTVNEVSKDITLPKIEWSKGRTLKPVLHRNGKVTTYLKCSKCPVEVSIAGLVSLASFLGGTRTRLVSPHILSNSQFEENKVPRVEDWLVVQWHYGRDGAREISGPAFNVTFKTWFNELARIYMRHNGQLLKPRLEVIETPKKTLPEAFAEKIDPCYKR